MSSPPFYRSLRFKLTALLSLIIIIGATVGWYVTAQLIEREFRNMIHQQMESTIESAENVFAITGQTASTWGDHFATDSQLRQSVIEGDSAGIGKWLASRIKKATVDLLVFVDREGRILYHSKNSDRLNESVMNLRIVRSALLGKESATAIVHELENFVIYTSEPLLVDGAEGPEVVGAVMVGYLINDRLLQGIKTGTLNEITIVRRRAVMASTFNSEKQRLSTIPFPFITYQMFLLSPKHDIGLFDMFGERYFIDAKKLALMEPGMEGSVLLAYPERELREAREHLMFRFTLLVIVGVLLVVLVSGKVSRKALSPLRALVNKSDAIASGEMPDVISIDSKDEIGELADHFNRMVDIIREKNRDLEQYSEELEHKVVERTSKLNEINEELKTLAMTDPLTGILNRRALFEYAGKEVARSKRHGHPVSLLALDIDFFKEINDTCGHADGDVALQAFTESCNIVLRADDFFGRIGGEEFVALLPDTDIKGAINLAERLRSKIEKLIVKTDQHSFGMTTSIGVACLVSEDAGIEALMRRADTALYQAKETGRNRVVS